jgi:hypothetical protein
MKIFKYIILGVILLSLVVSSFSFSPSNRPAYQAEKMEFCETYTRQEILSRLDKEDKLNTLFYKEGTDPGSARIGTCPEADLKALWIHIQSEAFRAKVPEDLIILAGAEAADQMISLYAIRKSGSHDAFPSPHDIGEVSVSRDNEDNFALLISFTESGATTWASMTRKNKGRDIAILFDGKVIAAPRVQEEIKGGKCMISGNYTESEVYKLKAALEN